MINQIFSIEPLRLRHEKKKNKEIGIIGNCICGNKVFHTRECKIRRERDAQNKNKKKQRRKLRAENRCIICAEKIKPIIIYHQYCKKHKPKRKK